MIKIIPSILFWLLLAHSSRAQEPAWRFTEVAADAGLTYAHGYIDGAPTEPRRISGGAAIGDVNGDGWIDLYAVRGERGPGLLFINRGDGSFSEEGAAWGLPREITFAVGPAFGDIDGDGRLDLFLGGIEGAKPRLFRNTGSVFVEITAQSGLTALGDTFGCAFGDYDRDGDLDLFLAHWTLGLARDNHLWRNEGDGSFTAVDGPAGISGFEERDYSFTPNFADLNDDGWPDLLVACDFGASQVLMNRGGVFENVTGAVITDENGMGASVADYDNDGDLDWFVSSIWDPDGVVNGNWGVTGNRLYRNRGDGDFEDVTEQARVRRGYWGWGSAFADLNNDGWLDLAHVNGFLGPLAVEFYEDPTRVFIADGAGSFAERSRELGVVDTGQGRGLAAFDYDRDGDLDLFVANNSGPPALYRNDGPVGNFLAVRLSGPGADLRGARLWARVGSLTLTRELDSGNYFMANRPREVHFGLGDAEKVDALTVRFPTGEIWRREDIAANQWVELGPPGQTVPALDGPGLALLIFAMATAAWMLARRR